MKKNNPTIKDVAKMSGVSVATVSRVINKKGYLSDETREKVLNVIDDIGYVPNQLARSLYKKKSKLIGVIVPTIENPYFAELVYCIEKELELIDYKLVLCNSLNDVDIEKKYLEMLIENQVDGIIVGTHNEELAEYSISNIPIVAIERFLNNKKIPTICCDNYLGGKLATEYLINKGCKNIACISGQSKENFPAQGRYDAYVDVVTENNLIVNSILVPNLDINKRRDFLECKLKELYKIDGIFATDDILAVLIDEILMNNMKKKIPIVGFDGTILMKNLHPNLVTIEQPISTLAMESVNTLIKLINNENIKKIQIYPVKLHKL